MTEDVKYRTGTRSSHISLDRGFLCSIFCTLCHTEPGFGVGVTRADNNMSTSPEDPPTESGAPDSAATEPLACTSCRSRKLKCDRHKPICTRCAKVDGECVYPESRRKPAFKRRNVKELEERLVPQPRLKAFSRTPGSRRGPMPLAMALRELGTRLPPQVPSQNWTQSSTICFLPMVSPIIHRTRTPLQRSHRRGKTTPRISQVVAPTGRALVKLAASCSASGGLRACRPLR